MADGRHFYYLRRCPCGAALTGDTEDYIVDVSLAHLREVHPELASEYEREHILFMATRLKR